MSAEIVNLNKFRKARQKEQEQETAAENRRKYGRTKAEKNADDAESAETARHVDAHQLRNSEDDD